MHATGDIRDAGVTREQNFEVNILMWLLSFSKLKCCMQPPGWARDNRHGSGKLEPPDPGTFLHRGEH